MLNVNEFKVIIAGSREFEDYTLLKSQCDYYLQNKLNDPYCTVVIVSGHARGADSLGERYAREMGLRCDIYPADWKTLGKRAGYVRNEIMAKVSNAAIIFLSAYGENKGSQHMIDIAKRDGLNVKVVQEEP